MGLGIRCVEDVADVGLFDSIEQGKFADIRRARDGGKGADGVIRKDDDYWNPVAEFLDGKVHGAGRPQTFRLG